ncbi:hypothetical protein [Flavobacterium oreochromis]|nr:hypothetical protein [Flavobacterium oreochromis]
MKKQYIFLIIFFTIIISIIVYKYEILKSIDPTLLTLFSGGIGFIISKFIENLKESKQRIYEQKRVYYNELIKPFRDILKNTKLKTSTDNKLNDKQISNAMDSAFDNILYASDEVILKYGNFRNSSQNNDTNIYRTLKLFAELLLAMRKDLGNNFTNLDEVEILRMFINMTKEEESFYRNEFKKIK